MAGASDAAKEADRTGRLSGLVPLVVIGLIAFLFIRSCIGDLDLGLGLGGDSDEERELTEPPPEGEDEDGGNTAPEDDPEMAAMLEPAAPECPADDEDGEDTPHLQWTEAPDMCIDETADYTAIVRTDRGDIEIDLDTENAPRTVNNFVFLARWHYYDGVTIHSIFPDVSIQTGDPIGDPPGTGGPGYTIEREPPTERPFYPLYSVAMANSTETGSAGRTHGSVFFIISGTEAEREASESRLGQIADPDSRQVVDNIDDLGNPNAPEDPGRETTIETVTIRQN